MLTQIIWLYLVVYGFALPLGGPSKRDTPPAKADLKKNLKDTKLPLPFSSSSKLFNEGDKTENIMQNNADMALGDNNDDEDEKYYNDDDEPDECCGKDMVQPRPDLNSNTNTAETKEGDDVGKCECVPKVPSQVVNDSNDTVTCNDTAPCSDNNSCNNTCASRSEGADEGADSAEDTEGASDAEEDDPEDDPEDEEAPEDEDASEAVGFKEGGSNLPTCHTCEHVEHVHHHHDTPRTNTDTDAQHETKEVTKTKFHRHEHDHFHHETPQMITCLHDHHHHHHHHHQHHHFHYQPYCCKCDGKVAARHKQMDMSKVNSESPNELGSEVIDDDANVVSGDGEMMMVGPERPEWAPPPPNAESCKSRSPGEESSGPSEHIENATNVDNSTTKGNDTALVNDNAKANITQMVFSSVARICDFLHNKSNSYKVVHDDDTAKRCCICRAKKIKECQAVKRCDCPKPPCGHHHGCHECHDDCCHDHCPNNCDHQYDSHDHHGPPCDCHGPPCDCHGPPCDCHGPPCDCHNPPCDCHRPPCDCHRPCDCPCSCNDGRPHCGCGCQDEHIHHNHHHDHHDNDCGCSCGNDCGNDCCQGNDCCHDKPCCDCHNKSVVEKHRKKKN